MKAERAVTWQRTRTPACYFTGSVSNAKYASKDVSKKPAPKKVMLFSLGGRWIHVWVLGHPRKAACWPAVQISKRVKLNSKTNGVTPRRVPRIGAAIAWFPIRWNSGRAARPDYTT